MKVLVDDAAKEHAISVTKTRYVEGAIDEVEAERRIGIILGLQGPAAQSEALSTTEYADVTALGEVARRYLPTRWEWPDDSRLERGTE